MRARYYDPTTAQFLTTDPLAAITQEPYSYANDNPIDHTDPSGLDWVNNPGPRLAASYCQQHPNDQAICGSGPSARDWAGAVGAIVSGGAGEAIGGAFEGAAAEASDAVESAEGYNSIRLLDEMARATDEAARPFATLIRGGFVAGGVGGTIYLIGHRECWW
jgi:hypothetical protein